MRHQIKRARLFASKKSITCLRCYCQQVVRLVLQRRVAIFCTTLGQFMKSKSQRHLGNCNWHTVQCKSKNTMAKHPLVIVNIVIQSFVLIMYAGNFAIIRKCWSALFRALFLHWSAHGLHSSNELCTMVLSKEKIMHWNCNISFDNKCILLLRILSMARTIT